MLPSIFCSLRERVVLYCHGQRHKRRSELWLRLALDTPRSLWLPWGWLSTQPIQGWKEAGVKERYVFGLLPWTPPGGHGDCRIFPPFSLRRTYISEIRKHGKCSEFRCLRAYVQGNWISGVAPYGKETVLKMWGTGAGWDSQAPVGGCWAEPRGWRVAACAADPTMLPWTHLCPAYPNDPNVLACSEIIKRELSQSRSEDWGR